MYCPPARISAVVADAAPRATATSADKIRKGDPPLPVARFAVGDFLGEGLRRPDPSRIQIARFGGGGTLTCMKVQKRPDDVGPTSYVAQEETKSEGEGVRRLHARSATS